MLKVFIDTNVIIDALDSTREGHRDAMIILEHCRRKELEGFISALTLPNLVYILERQKYEGGKIWMIIQRLKDTFTIEDLTGADTLKPFVRNCPDYEDGLQMLAAERIKVDYIITGDKRGFMDAKVPVISPSRFVVNYYI